MDVKTCWSVVYFAMSLKPETFLASTELMATGTKNSSDKYDSVEYEDSSLFNQLMRICCDCSVCHVYKRQKQQQNRVTVVVRPKC